MTRLTLLHTNDLHGRLGKLTRIAAQVKKIKQNVTEEGGVCFYLDAGDSEDTTQLESSLTKGSVMGTLLRAAGCDVMTLGNALPVRYGEGVIKPEAENFGKTILCANLLQGDGSRIDGLEPYHLLQFGPLKLAVIGLTTPVSVYSSIFHLQYREPADILPALVSKVRAEGAQFVIALTHIGSPEDKKLAETVPGVDLFIGGHDHVAIDPPLQVENCVIAQTGKHGEFLGRIDLEIDDTSGRIISRSGKLIPITPDLPEDAVVVEAIRTESLYIEKMMTHVLGRVEFPIDLAFDRECVAGNLMADALLSRFPGAQFSFALVCHWVDGLPAGDITARALFSANRSTANPACAKLTGAQVIQFLKNAMRPENASRAEIKATRGTPVGWPHVSGLELIWDGQDPDSLKVMYQGKALDPERRYVVVATDIEFSAYIGYLPLEDGLVQYEVPTIMPEVLQEYLAVHNPLQVIQNNRIRVEK
jgi:2',3'-cyclic-nucleotide 2'-phosphodiesterase (5'-nucleotidase family)